MADPLARQDALEELVRIVRGLQGGGQHVLVLSDYEVANLKEVFRAAGVGAVVDRNPIQAIHNGDWTAQIAARLPSVDHKPNEDWQVLAQKAKDWK